MDINTHPIWMITGERQAGKSAFCRAIADTARQAGWDVAGLLSPALIKGGTKTGILAEDLRTGESRPLAYLSRQSQENLAFGDWFFNRQTLAWGNHVLEKSLPCDLLIIDELGPLELIHHIGWQSALKILPQGGYRLALVVIRPELHAIARIRLDFAEVITLDRSQPTDIWVRDYWPRIIEYKIGP